MKQIDFNKKVTVKILFFLTIISASLLSIKFFYQKNQNWQFYVDQSIGPNNKLTIFDNLTFNENEIFFSSQNKNTYSLNQNSGQINWIFKAEDYSPFPPTIDGDQIFLSNFDGNIYCLDKNTGYKIWQFNTEKQSQPDTPILKSANNNLVFFGSRNGALYALNSNDGTLIWKKQFQKLDSSKAFIARSIHFGSIYLDEEKIYVFNSLEKSFISINQLDGSINWQIDNLLFDYRSPIFLQKNIIIKQDQYLLSVDKKSGSIKEIKRNGKENVAWEVFEIENNDRHILVLDDHALMKIDNEFHEVEWTLNNVDNILYFQKNTESPIVKIIENKIIAQTFSRIENLNILLFVDYDNGEITKTQKVENWINNQLYVDNKIFLSSGTGVVYRINSDTLEINWKVAIDGEIKSLHLFEDNLLTISLKSSGKISLEYLDQETGEKKWTYASNFISNKKDVYVQDRSVYIFNQDNTILNKIDITNNKPKDKKIKKINFIYDQTKNIKDPYLKIETKNNKLWEIKQKKLAFKYLLKNFKNIYSFMITEDFKDNILEISIKHDENLYHNKFTDLKINAVFENKNKKEKIKISGFYFDHNTWKIRFSAPSPGEYEYQISIKSPFKIEKYSGTVQLNTGKDEVISTNQDLFVINDEKVFFPLGIQDIFTDRNYNGNLMDMMSNSSTTEPVSDVKNFSYLNIDDYLDLYQKEGKINIFRYGVDHWTMPLWHSINPENIVLSVNGGKFGDNLIEKLRERNIKIIMTIFGFYPPYRSYEEIIDEDNQQALAIYLDYVIARFSPYVDLWELSNEAEAHELWYEFVIDYLQENDPYHHPISTNWETESAKNLNYLSVHWYNPDSTDSGTLSNQIDYLKQKYQNAQQPIFITEFGFKNNSFFQNSSESMRILTWLSIFQKMGIIFWTQGQNGIYNNPNNANIYLGPIERSYLSILNDFLPENFFIPITSELILIPDLQVQVYLLKNNDFILAYLLKIDKSSKNQDYFQLNLQNSATLQWIDPKTGLIIEEQQLESETQNILVPNFNVDLAMRISYLYTNK
jgi:outer membrane protein assembly factor BamB